MQYRIWLLCLIATLFPGGHVRAQALVDERVRTSLVTVESDLWSGPGCIVDPAGLVVTSAAAAIGEPWTVVRFPNGDRRRGTVLAHDRTTGIAVVSFAPESVSGWTVIPMGSRPPFEAQPIVVLSDPAMAGSIYRTDPASILTDKPLADGGDALAVLNRAGEVIAFTTNRPAGVPDSGDVWGYVPLERGTKLLETAREKAANPPPADPLPTVSSIPIPIPALVEAAKQDRPHREVDSPKSTEAFLMTPFSILSTSRHPKGWDHLPEPLWGSRGMPVFMDWMGLSAPDPVVVLEVLPILKETERSKWVKALMPKGYITPGHPLEPASPTPHYDSALKPGLRNFQDLPEPTVEESYRQGMIEVQLLRNGKVVEPVRRIRFPLGVWNRPFTEAPANSIWAAACAYDPSAFELGATITLRYRTTSAPDRWSEYAVKPAVQQAVWDDFAPWRTAAKPAD